MGERRLANRHQESDKPDSGNILSRALDHVVVLASIPSGVFNGKACQERPYGSASSSIQVPGLSIKQFTSIPHVLGVFTERAVTAATEISRAAWRQS